MADLVIFLGFPILYAILCVPEGIFMPLLQNTLVARLTSPTTTAEQERWIIQIVSAAAWLEKLGYCHGDLRPENILLDKLNHIRVADFDSTVNAGEELRVATLPFCKVDEKYKSPPAGPETEQFSLGSCIYNIRFGFPPYSDLGLEEADWHVMLARGEYPSTSEDIFGPIIQDCWHGSFPSISALETEVIKLTGAHQASPNPPRHHLWFLRAECREFVASQRLLMEGSYLDKVQLRYQVLIWGIVRTGLSLFYH
jgi:serine/threonine protein kinase